MNAPRAAIYARVSTVRQAEGDLSLPDQIKQIEAYCERKGWTVVQVYAEPGASARDDDRPVFQDMIAAATGPDRPYDFVVVHSLSRFSRDVLHSELYIRALRKSGVTLVSITQELGSDPHSEMIRKILSVFDEHSSHENAKHTHQGMLENARQGFWNGAPPPFGYTTAVRERRGDKDKKVLVIREDEAAVVRQIFDLYVGRDSRPLGLKAICNHLNERGITKRGHKFGIGSLQKLMRSATYCGCHYFNQRNSRTGAQKPPSEWVAVAVPPIVDEETFNRVQQGLSERSPRKTPLVS